VSAGDTLNAYDRQLWAGRFGNYDDEMLQSWCDGIAQGGAQLNAIDALALAELERRRARREEKGPT
jgi:hypothetical protein